MQIPQASGTARRETNRKNSATGFLPIRDSEACYVRSLSLISRMIFPCDGILELVTHINHEKSLPFACNARQPRTIKGQIVSHHVISHPVVAIFFIASF